MKIQESIIPTLKNDEIVTAANARVGARVRRGPDWRWDNQDGSGEGTILSFDPYTQWANVLWDNSYKNEYRIGDDPRNGFAYEGYDLIFAE
jgi:E3 ubiquitin-protein ligase HECTD1